MSNHRENNFDIIRLVAAAMVIVSHASGLADPLFTLTNGLTMGTLGVYIFFTISGYLVSQSFIHRSSNTIFFVNRCLRIFPGLLCVLLFAMVVVGPIFTTRSVKEYFSSSETYMYLGNLTLMKLQYYLPGLFVFDGKQRVVNVPLWTLVFEFAMYIIVAVYGTIGLLKKSPLSIAFQVIALCAAIYGLLNPEKGGFYLLKVNVKLFTAFYSYFFVGALMGYFMDKIKFNAWTLIGLMILWWFSLHTFVFPLICLVLTAYTIFYFAFFPKPLGKFITKRGDFSYGLYLYGYVIQNVIVTVLGHHVPVWEMILLCLAGTFPFALLSWFLVEKKALNFKKILSEKWVGNESAVNKRPRADMVG